VTDVVRIEVVSQKTEAWHMAAPPPALVRHVENLDNKGISGFRPVDGYRPSQSVGL
jgi:hypothetical protein